MLHKDQFNRVEVPDFLLENIKKKINLKERQTRLQTRILVAAACICLFVNIGVISQYSDNNQAQNEADINPFSTLNTISYE